jgi:2-polyprenyl-3-methyl-5-hydroxy-6-metoxy-1,4-benzoquinol methylase
MKKSWDSTWEKIYSSREWGRYPPEELIRFVARNFYSVENRKDVKFLDIGCGTGAAAWFIAREGFTVYGIDGSETAIEIVKKVFEKEKLAGEFKVGDIINLDYPDNFFDCIVDVNALQHNKPENIKIILKQCLRVLKPGGKMFSMMVGEKSKFEM